MEKDPEEYSLIKEMLIAFIGGGTLGLVLLVIAECVVEFFKR